MKLFLISTTPPQRLANLEKAIAADACGRAKDVQKEIDFVMSRRDDVSKLVDLQVSGKIPERITHNDTKLNNVMIDDATGKGVCVIDLDTVYARVWFITTSVIWCAPAPAPPQKTKKTCPR